MFNEFSGCPLHCRRDLANAASLVSIHPICYWSVQIPAPGLGKMFTPTPTPHCRDRIHPRFEAPITKTPKAGESQHGIGCISNSAMAGGGEDDRSQGQNGPGRMRWLTRGDGDELAGQRTERLARRHQNAMLQAADSNSGLRLSITLGTHFTPSAVVDPERRRKKRIPHPSICGCARGITTHLHIHSKRVVF